MMAKQKTKKVKPAPKGKASWSQMQAHKLLHQEVIMFHQVMEGMRKGLAYPDLLKLIVTAVTKGLGYDRAGIFLTAPGGRIIERVIGIDARGRFEFGADEKTRHPLSNRKGFSVLSDLVNGYKEYFLSNNILKKMPGAAGNVVSGVTCNANVPLNVGKGRIIGVLAVDNLFTKRSLIMSDIHSLTNFATQAGLAIESIRLHEENRNLSITDELTGLYNRRYFDGYLAQEILRCQRYRHPCGLLFADIDHFKRFNDRWGHLVGDDILRHVSDVLRSSVRNVDTVSRVGGEEFAIVLPEATETDVFKVAERLVKSVAETIPQVPEVLEAGEKVTVSVGVACFPRSAAHPEKLLEMADKSMYRAKSMGRNRVGEMLTEG
jgi:diguanylate cyclase (GGDEF)-like protein